MAERRIGSEDSRSRTALLDAALALMLEEGYAAVTSRKVAARAGLKPQLVHYYFRTMDDLFLALVRRGAEHNLARQERALASAQPLWALWALSDDPDTVALNIEVAALANHRKTIKADIGEHAHRIRRQQLDALGTALAGDGTDDRVPPPVELVVLLNAVTQVLAMEDGMGLHDGHAEVRALVERWISQIEGPRREPAARP